MKQWIVALTLCFTTFTAAAEERNKPETIPTGEEVDVSKVTEKYWAQGKDSELGVVQNRKYSNENRIEFDILAGRVSYDPFQSVSALGASVGYYFNQYLSASAFFWELNVSDSDAFLALKTQAPSADLFRNNPKSIYGIQINENLLYGKASLFGKLIIYVDLFILGGAGISHTASGNSFAPFLGIGQKIHISRNWIFHLDYRVTKFDETVTNSAGATRARSNTSDSVMFGLGFQY